MYKMGENPSPNCLNFYSIIVKTCIFKLIKNFIRGNHYFKCFNIVQLIINNIFLIF